MTELNTSWQNHSIAIPTTVRLLRSWVWPVVSYGCEKLDLEKFWWKL